MANRPQEKESPFQQKGNRSQWPSVLGTDLSVEARRQHSLVAPVEDKGVTIEGTDLKEIEGFPARQNGFRNSFSEIEGEILPEGSKKKNGA